jgi:5,6-dimethylbenzimidazole synthase
MEQPSKSIACEEERHRTVIAVRGGCRAMKPAATEPTQPNTCAFDETFRQNFENLLKWRRDVRSFRSDPIDARLVEHLICLASLAPSVGYSQPWRFVLVESDECRESVRANFEHCNREALNLYSGEKARLYASLKLAGLCDAPVQLAVFLSQNTDHGSGLGRITMPETLEYSAVLAVHSLWLAARAYGLGLGWVSILDPVKVNRGLHVPYSWKLIAYLCIGYPKEADSSPELLRRGWEATLPLRQLVLKR